MVSRSVRSGLGDYDGIAGFHTFSWAFPLADIGQDSGAVVAEYGETPFGWQKGETLLAGVKAAQKAVLQHESSEILSDYSDCTRIVHNVFTVKFYGS